jgi:uridine phosphorylase|tara:strand:- start:3729 stop:4592 length:864 start_codon:yes stop_codon:yes gene_type:complete
MQYPATELVLDANGHVYHLGLSIDNVAENIILVGDQDRVDLVASFFDSIEHSSQHREFVCKTGMYKGKRVTALSTGIGTDNIDITINELDALFNIDIANRVDKKEFTSLNLIRIGTCGILHSEIPVHSFILSTHAYGLDNVAHFYEIEFSEKEKALNKAITDHVGLPEGIQTYTTEASFGLFTKLTSDRTKEGITVTSSGFYGPQGRQLRLKNRTSELNDKLTSFNSGGHRITNFEMESSALFSLGKALGHECATICLGIANRPNKEFSTGYNDDMLELIEYVLDRI